MIKIGASTPHSIVLSCVGGDHRSRRLLARCLRWRQLRSLPFRVRGRDGGSVYRFSWHSWWLGPHRWSRKGPELPRYRSLQPRFRVRPRHQRCMEPGFLPRKEPGSSFRMEPWWFHCRQPLLAPDIPHRMRPEFQSRILPWHNRRKKLRLSLHRPLGMEPGLLLRKLPEQCMAPERCRSPLRCMAPARCRSPCRYIVPERCMELR